MDTSEQNNIYPIFDEMLPRQSKELLLNQHSKVIWLLGLSGSGKSTIAKLLEKELHQRGFFCQLLDGDNLRTGLNQNLGFSEEDRQENIRRTAEVAKLFVQAGVITIASFICPTHKIQEKVRRIIGESDFVEIFIDCPIEVCEQRDVKGLYAKARRGELKNFTGIDSPFEKPMCPDLTLETDKMSVGEAVKEILDYTLPLFYL